MAIYCANCFGTDHTESDPACPDNAGKPCHDVAPDGESRCVFGKGHAVRYHSKYPLEWWDGKWLKTRCLDCGGRSTVMRDYSSATFDVKLGTVAGKFVTGHATHNLQFTRVRVGD